MKLADAGENERCALGGDHIAVAAVPNHHRRIGRFGIAPAEEIAFTGKRDALRHARREEIGVVCNARTPDKAVNVLEWRNARRVRPICRACSEQRGLFGERKVMHRSPRANRVKDEEAVPHGEVHRPIAQGIVDRLKLWWNTSHDRLPALFRCLRVELPEQQRGSRLLAVRETMNRSGSVLFRKEEVMFLGYGDGPSRPLQSKWHQRAVPRDVPVLGL